MTPEELRDAVANEIAVAIGSLEGCRDRLNEGEDPLTVLRSVEAIGHNAELDAMMLARKAPRG